GSTAAKIAGLLNEKIGDIPAIICLNEVSQNAYERIKTALRPTWSDLSLTHRPTGQYESGERKLGVAVLAACGRGHSDHLIWRAVFPERHMCYN
ncbi:MAG: hypothetical protein ACR2PY_09545, partial [Salinispira sp.]